MRKGVKEMMKGMRGGGGRNSGTSQEGGQG